MTDIPNTAGPLFSVVIPTYNRADLIMETLQTVLQQTYKRVEILVVDNCSTDNTETLLAALVAEGRIRYIRHDKNYERSRSRNTGIINATGDFISFLDSDDFMYPDALKDAAEYAAKNPDIRIFQNLYELVSNERKPIYQFTFPPLDNQYKALSSGNFISCIGGFIHREVYKDIRFNEDPKMIGSEDYEIWFEILARHRMGRIPKINSGIREHPSRSVNTGIYHNLEYQKNYLIEKIKTNSVLFDKFGPYLNLLQASFLQQQAVALNQLKQKGKAIKATFKALTAFPAIIATKRFYSVLYNILK